MLLQFYQLIGKNKEVDHKALGLLSCNGLQDSHRKCIELMNTNSVLETQCKSLYELSFQCYKSKTGKEFLQWIDGEINEKRRLNKFLVENDSVLPELQRKNIVQDIFAGVIDEENIIEKEENEQTREIFIDAIKDNVKYFDLPDQ